MWHHSRDTDHGSAGISLTLLTEGRFGLCSQVIQVQHPLAGRLDCCLHCSDSLPAAVQSVPLQLPQSPVAFIKISSFLYLMNEMYYLKLRFDIGFQVLIAAARFSMRSSQCMKAPDREIRCCVYFSQDENKFSRMSPSDSYSHLGEEPLICVGFPGLCQLQNEALPT